MHLLQKTIRATIILSSDSHQDLNLIVRLAKKLGISAKKLSVEEIEEISLSIAIKKGKTGEYIDTGTFLKELDHEG